MKNDFREIVTQAFAMLVPYFVRTITSFIKYGTIAGLVLTIYSIRGYLRISNCCWIIILSGTLIELIKVIMINIINKYKEDENGHIN